MVKNKGPVFYCYTIYMVVAPLQINLSSSLNVHFFSGEGKNLIHCDRK